MFLFDGPNRIIYVESPTISFSAIDLYSEWKRWMVQTPENSKYLDAMRSIGGEAISATKYIAGYIELLNTWRIKPYDGTYQLTVVGNLFATGGSVPFLNANSGSVLVNMETTGNALALETNTDTQEDITAPQWISSVGIIDAYQAGGYINIRWGGAVDLSSVQYNVYISDNASTVWNHKLGSFSGSMYNIGTEFDGVTSLRDIPYYIGVRATDEHGNETTNVNTATVNFQGGSISDTDVNIVSVNGIAVQSIEDFKADVTLIPQNVWAYVSRTLTDPLGLTPAQEAKIDQILLNIEEEAKKIKNTTIAVS